MPAGEVIEVETYRIRVSRGIVTGVELVTLRITDSDGDGLIDRDEWAAHFATGGVAKGHNAGENREGWLWHSERDGSRRNGDLYGATPFEEGENVTAILDTLDPNFSAVNPALLIPAPVCFAAGTRIATPCGARRVEDLRAGDLVLTMDHGAQPVLWTGRRHLGAAQLDLRPDLRPIRIAAGALRPGLPRRDILLSPQHRVLIQDPRLNAPEGLLVSARLLLQAGWPGVSTAREFAEVVYCHIALADHQIVLAEGAATESLFTGPVALRQIGPADRARLIRALPALAEGKNPMTPARPFARRGAFLRAMRGRVMAG
ncbi:MAG: Hint domain-containing protein [Paracoccus sp. (in: a-proteobacteria)]|nr:Hint domain-containing protein [Paracoccus sp. (in: a-proteobacteria)]